MPTRDATSLFYMFLTYTRRSMISQFTLEARFFMLNKMRLSRVLVKVTVSCRLRVIGQTAILHHTDNFERIYMCNVHSNAIVLSCKLKP